MSSQQMGSDAFHVSCDVNVAKTMIRSLYTDFVSTKDEEAKTIAALSMDKIAKDRGVSLSELGLGVSENISVIKEVAEYEVIIAMKKINAPKENLVEVS
ncbi:MAG: hypothetical protein JWM20_278 [Patescibacteria group bacterium]|nr:hypothetical protein [Patescibacteria group bacterium]